MIIGSIITVLLIGLAWYMWNSSRDVYDTAINSTAKEIEPAKAEISLVAEQATDSVVEPQKKPAKKKAAAKTASEKPAKTSKAPKKEAKKKSA